MTWAEAEEQFKVKFPAYEPRIPQRNLALAVEDALLNADDLIAQAPCGVGKSFVAMIPAIDYSKKVGKPVVLSTATRALQDQYVRDAEALSEMLDEPFVATTLKGRANYVCRAKLDEFDSSYAETDIKALWDELNNTASTGDFDTLATPVAVNDKYKLATSSDECPGKRECPFGKVCFAEQAKERARNAQLIITNHALLVVDSTLKSMAEDRSEGVGIAVLPDYAAVVVDEGHEFEDYATNALGSEFTEKSLKRLARDAAAFLGERDWQVKADRPTEALFMALSGQMPERERTVAMTPDLLVEVGEQLDAVLAMLRSLSTAIARREVWGSDAEELRKRRIRKRTDKMLSRLENIVMADFSELVRWVERDDKRGIVLKYAPLDVAPYLREFIWQHVPSVIMSATMATGVDKAGNADFSYPIRTLGFETDTRTFDCESPFDFSRQAKIFVPDIPDPKVNPGGFRAGQMYVLSELIKAADGRALILCTSWVSLNELHRSVAPVLETLGHRVLKQGDMPNRRLAQTFTDDEHSVLFAVKSFFTGVDVKGDSLRLVVVDKCPFPVPSDVIFKARSEAIDKLATRFNEKSFAKLSVPMMTLVLQQGIGRLIRTATDRGLIAILDPRLADSFWGKPIMKALPPAPVTRDLAEATNFLRSLDAETVVT
jgi:ATP-dependent DNA helicase DinG